MSCREMADGVGTTEGEWLGQSARVLHSGGLEVVLLPSRGGKIASLRDRAGREWLEGPRLPFRALGEGSFVDGDMFGWDECAPTIVACQLKGAALPDHGELWSQPWRCDMDGWLTVQGVAWDYTFSRRVSLARNHMVLDYRVVSGSTPIPFLWAAHPQFRVESDTRIVLEPGPSSMLDVQTDPPRRCEGSPAWRVSDTPAGDCRKLYVAPGFSLDRARLVNANGSRLSLSWSPEVRYFGVWVDRSLYARHDVVAFEPTTGFFDSCELAFSRDRVTMIEPYSEFSWSLTLTIDEDDL